MEMSARMQLARASLLTGDLRRARAESDFVVRLAAPATTRPHGIRDAGSLALAVGDVSSARACLDRLARLDAAGTNAIVHAAHLFLAGELAAHERHPAVAIRLLDESYARWPFYATSRVRAEASEEAGDWAGAAAAWSAVLAAKGQILQEGFPPDLELARAGLKRANGNLSRKDK